MKKILALVALISVTALNSFGQGAVLFKNFGAGSNGTLGSGVIIFDEDGTTRLNGTGFSAQLWAGPSGTPAGSLTAVAAPISFIAPGLFGSPTLTVSGVGIGQVATLQVRVWNNAGGTITSYAAATSKASSVTFNVTLSDPADLTAGSTPVLIGMNSFSLSSTPVPEPATYALLGLGALGFALRRRDRKSVV